jgi:hypothetical protein
MAIATILNYTGSTNKSVNIRSGYVRDGYGIASLTTGSTSITNAITRMDLTIEGGATWTSDTTLELFGIKG